MTESRQTDATAKGFRPRSLDAINFLLADVRGALGPYLNVFLVTRQHWSLSEVGLVTTIGGLIGLALQTPAGALIDSTRAKRGFVVAALAVLATGATVIALWPNFWPVLIANSLIAVVGDIFGPAIAALTLGLVAGGRARPSPTSSQAFGRGARSRRDERKTVTCRTNRRAADRPERRQPGRGAL